MGHLFSVFSRRELRNIFVYAFGIMCYKFALEYFNGAFITLANERFGKTKYTKISILVGLNAAMQCVGSILIAPLIKKYPTRTVLSYAVLVFGIISSTVLIADAATGGIPKFRTADNKTHYGSWNPNGLFPIYIISGIAYGMVELIRRVIPRDIVGGDVQKLRRMDSVIHVLYEVAGTAGAFTSTSLIGKFGYNFSSFLSPVLFTLAAVVWRFVTDVSREQRDIKPANGDLAAYEDGRQTYTRAAIDSFRAFGKATYKGALLVTSSRKYIWLIPGYSMALYGHRYLENGLAPIYAKQVIGVSSYSQIIVGGSNFGELLGALSVLLSTNRIPTPIPWLRLDALMLNLVWIMPFFPATRGQVKSAWTLAACFIPISYGWAAGDVSLAAYIQSSLARIESQDKDVSALGAVMAFLYVTYIVLYAILSPLLGRWVDSQLADGVSPRDILKYGGGTQMTVLAVIIISATLIPKGALALNPPLIDDYLPEGDEETNSVPEKDSSSIDKQASDDEPQTRGVQTTDGLRPPVANEPTY